MNPQPPSSTALNCIRDSRASRVLAHGWLAIFLWGQLYPVGAMAADAAASLKSKQKPAPTISLQKSDAVADALQRMLLRVEAEKPAPAPRAEAILKTSKPLAERKQLLKSLRQTLAEQTRQTQKEFSETTAYIAERRLPDRIRQRHAQVVADYQTRSASLLSVFDAADRAATETDFKSGASKALEALQSREALPASAPALKRSPFRVPENKIRAPKLKATELSSLIGSDTRYQVADGGDAWKILAISAVGLPLPTDLLPTEDVQINDAITALAAQLHNNPVEIYAWVKNQIRYQPTHGSIQGSVHTLQSKQGNAYDIASLLIALLRAAGIPARYVYGTVEIPAAQLQNALGGLKQPEAALNLLAQGGIPSRSVVSAGQVQSIQMEHVWVEAYVDFYPSRGAKNITPDTWAPLDASFKSLDLTAGLHLASNVSTDAFGLVNQLERTATLNNPQGRISGLDQGAIQSALTQYQTQVNNYISAINPAATVGEVLGTRTLQNQNIPVLPASLPYAVIASGTPASELATNLRHQFRFSLHASAADRANNIATVSFNRSLPALSGKRLTLSFSPVTPDDQAALDSYFPAAHVDGSPVQPSEFPSEIPGYLIHLKAELRLDGDLIASGGDFPMGTSLLMTNGLFDPTAGVWNDSDDTLIAGEYQAFAIDGAGISPAELEASETRLTAVTAKLTARQYETLTRDAVSGEALHNTALGYFAITDGYAKHYQRAAAISAHRLPSAARAAAEILPTYQFGVPAKVSFPGIAVRVDHLAASAVAIHPELTRVSALSAAYQKQTLERGSAYAHLVLETLYSAAAQGAPASSAIKALATAMGEGSAIYALDRNNLALSLPQINVPDAVRTEIGNGVNQGRLGIVSENPVTIAAWQGSGYILADSDTGAGAYLLTGGATSQLQSQSGSPWLALASPAQSSGGIASVLTSAQSLVSAQKTLNGDTDGLNWFDLFSRSEILSGLYGSLLSGITSPLSLSWAIDVQTVRAGTGNASDLTQANRPPVFTTSPITTATATKPYHYSASAADPDGNPITYSLAQGPGGLSISGTGHVSWSQPIEGQWPVSLRISDDKSQALQTYTLKVKATPDPIEINLTVAPQIVDAGQPVSLIVNASGGSGALTKTLTLNNQPVTLNASGQATIAAPATSGVYALVATVTDEDNNTKTQNATLSVRTGADTTPPFAEILSPAADTEITAPVTVTGTATDNAVLAYYQLMLRPAGSGENDWVEIARGAQAVTNGALGQLDPTRLQNGLYDLALFATDANGLTSISNVPIEINRDLKIGQFSITFEDLNVEAAGIPIRVTRTYDTRRKGEKLDFGYGWSADYQSFQLRKNMTLGLGWEIYQQQLSLCVRVIGKRKINITLPDGSVDRFEVENTNACALTAVPPVDVAFRPLPGTTSRLELYNVPTLEFRNGQLYDMDNFGPYNPTEFKLTTEDQITYYLKEGVGIVRAQDAYGNSLDYTVNGILHSDGRSIPIIRDSQGRIAEVSDPAGKKIRYTYNAAGDLISVTDREGKVTTLAYNSDHGLTDYTDARGIKVAKQIYDDEGRLIATIDANGQRTDVVHDTVNSQEVVKDRNGNVSVYEYDSAGNVTRLTNALNQTTTYTYDALGNETSVTNAQNETITRSFNPENGKLLVETNPLGHTTTNTYSPATTYDKSQKLLSTRDARGHLTAYANYAGNTPLFIQEPLGRTTSLGLGASGNLTSLNLAGESTQFDYDNKGNRTQETDAAGNISTYTFDSNGKEIQKTWTQTQNGIPKTFTESRTYDSEGRVTSVTDALGHKTQTLYNAAGKPIEETDAQGRKTQWVYDTQLRVIETRHSDGTSDKTGYDAEGNEISKTDRNGRTTRTEYDGLNRWIKRIDADGAFVTQTYDAAGREKTQTDARGNVTTNDYDAAGRLTSVTDALGKVTHYGYDANGNRTSVTDAKNQTTQFEYDALNRLTKTTYPDNSTSHITWTLQGRKETETDQNGTVTRFGYSPKGELTSVTQMLNGQELITRYTYDEAGNKVTQQDAQGRITRWSHDGNSRPTSRTLPGSQTESFQYDDLGNLERHTDFKQQVTQQRYDRSQRPILKLKPDNTRITTTYTATGQIATQTDSRGITSYRYDANDRLIQKEGPEGILSYSYDRNGNRTQVSTPGGSVQYQYDELNRLKSVTDHNNQQTTYDYDPNGNRTRASLPNNVTTTYEYDSNNRLTKLTHQSTDNNEILAQYRYTLRPNGQRQKLEEFISSQAANANKPDRRSTYAYDDLYRLTEEKVETRTSGTLEVSRTTQFTYDNTGNRLSQTETQGATTETTNYTYDANDRLLTETTTGTTSSSTTYSYDDNGNTTKKATTPATGSASVTLYAYDSDNRLTQIKQGTTEANATAIVSYSYDPDGNRTSATTADNTTTAFLVDTNTTYPEVLEEIRSGASTGKTHYVYADSDLISMTRAGQRVFYHGDALGSTRALSDSSGAVTDRYDYTAFGEIEAREGSTEASHLFTGEQYDAGTGLLYLRARYMDPRVMRFLTRDAFQGYSRDPITLHKYVYGNIDPANIVDPSGRVGLSAVGAGLSGVSILARIAVPAIRTLAIACAAQAVTTTVIGNSNVALTNVSGPCVGNQMRVQLQHGRSREVVKNVQMNSPESGVTTAQVNAGLRHLYYNREYVSWWTNELDRWLYQSIVSLSIKIGRIPPLGVSVGGNILREEIYHRGKEYRVDVENLRGRNLIR